MWNDVNIETKPRSKELEQCPPKTLKLTCFQNVLAGRRSTFLVLIAMVLCAMRCTNS